MSIEETFASLAAAVDKVTVALANVSGTTKAAIAAALNWDPLEHPRDVYGMFVKKGHGTYLYGKAKKATFTQSGADSKKTITYPMSPGDALYKTHEGNHFVLHPDGSIDWFFLSGKPMKTLAADSAVAKNWVKSTSGGGNAATLIDYAPAVEVKAPDATAAQVVIDDKAAQLADLLAGDDNTIPGTYSMVATGAVVYKASPDAKDYIIKHEGKVYYYASPEVESGNAVEVADADLPKYEKYTVPVQAYYDPGKAEKIKQDLAEPPPWEKELLQSDTGAAGVTTTTTGNASITFKGHKFYPGSKFYEHNKTANSYLVVEAPDGTPWKIDKTGKMISGAQAVQYLHNYHDITSTVIDANEAVDADAVLEAIKPTEHKSANALALEAAAASKQSVIDALPDGTVVVDGGINYGFAVKTGDSYKVFASDGTLTSHLSGTGAKSVFNNMLDNAKHLKDYKVFVKIGGTDTNHLFWVAEPVGHWEDASGNWDHTFSDAQVASNPAVMDDQTKKLDVLVGLPDGVEIADAGPGHSVAVKSGGLYALYDGKGKHIGSGAMAKAAYDAAIEDGVKPYVKGGGEPKVVLPPVVDAVKGKTPEQVAALPGALEAGKFYTAPSKNGTVYYVPNDDSYYAVAHKDEPFSAVFTDEVEHQPGFVHANTNVIKGYSEYHPKVAGPMLVAADLAGASSWPDVADLDVVPKGGTFYKAPSGYVTYVGPAQNFYLWKDGDGWHVETPDTNDNFYGSLDAITAGPKVLPSTTKLFAKDTPAKGVLGLPAEDEVKAANTWADIFTMFGGTGTFYKGDSGINSYFVPHGYGDSVYVYGDDSGFGLDTDAAKSIQFLKVGPAGGVTAWTPVPVVDGQIKESLFVEYPFGAVSKDVTVYKGSKEENADVWLVKMGSDGGYEQFSNIAGVWQSVAFNKSYYEKSDGTPNTVLTKNYTLVQAPQPKHYGIDFLEGFLQHVQSWNQVIQMIPDGTMHQDGDLLYYMLPDESAWVYGSSLTSEQGKGSFVLEHLNDPDTAGDASKWAKSKEYVLGLAVMSKETVTALYGTTKPSAPKAEPYQPAPKGHTLPTAGVLALAKTDADVDALMPYNTVVATGISGQKYWLPPTETMYVYSKLDGSGYGIASPETMNPAQFKENVKGIKAWSTPTPPANLGKSYYPHPSGTKKMVLLPGDKLYQHYKVKESFLLVHPDGTAVKYDKNGKAIDGHQQLAVLDKNYTDVTGWAIPEDSTLNVAAAKKVPTKKAAYKATLKKAAAAPAYKNPWGDDPGKTGLIGHLVPGVHVVDLGPGKGFYTWNPATDAYGSWSEKGVPLGWSDAVNKSAYEAAQDAAGSQGYKHFVTGAPAALVDSGVPQIGKIVPGTKVYKSKSNDHVWAVVQPDGTKYHYDDSSGYVEKTTITTSFVGDTAFWDDITPGTPHASVMSVKSIFTAQMKWDEAIKHFPAGTALWQGKHNGKRYVYAVDPTNPNKATQYTWDADGKPESDMGDVFWDNVKDYLASTTAYVPIPNPNDVKGDGKTLTPDEPSIIDFEAGYTLQPGDKVYQQQVGTDYEVISANGNYIASFTDFDPDTQTVKGKAEQSPEDSQAGWVTYVSDNYPLLVTGTDQPVMSAPWKTTLYESLPAGWQFIDAGPGKVPLVYDPSSDTYFAAYSNGTLTDPLASDGFLPEFKEAKAKALYGDGYPHYYIKPGVVAKPALPGPTLSTPAKTEHFYSLPVGSEMIDFHKFGAYVHNAATGEYYGINKDAHHVALTVETPETFQKYKEKALAGLADNFSYYEKSANYAPEVEEEPPTFAKAEVAPKSFAAASVKVTKAYWYQDGTYIEGWKTTQHKGADGYFYMMYQQDGGGPWTVSSGGYDKGHLATGFKTLKDAKYWVSQHATKKPVVDTPVDPNAPTTMLAEVHGMQVYLPPGSSLWTYSVPGGGSDTPNRYIIFTPYRQYGVVYDENNDISSTSLTLPEFLAMGYGNTEKVAQTALPEYTPPAPEVTYAEGMSADDPEKWQSTALYHVMGGINWDADDPSVNATLIGKAMLLMKQYRDQATGGAKAKATKTLNAMTKALALADYFQHKADGTPLPEGMAPYLMSLPDDIFKGVDVQWNAKYQTNSAVAAVQKELRKENFAASAKALTGKDFPPNYFLTSTPEPSPLTMAEAKEFLTKQGFPYADGVTTANVDVLLKMYVTGSPGNNGQAAVQQAKKTLAYAHAIVAYDAWLAAKAKEPTETKGSKKAKAKAKMDWASAQVKAAADAKALRAQFLEKWPAGLAKPSSEGPTLDAQVTWVNENANLDFTVPAASGLFNSWKPRVGILAALTGNPLFAALAQASDPNDATGINTPEWEAFAAWGPTQSWWDMFADPDADIDASTKDYALAMAAFGLDTVLAPPAFKATLMSRAVHNALKVKALPGSVDVQAHQHVGVKVEDPTLMPAERPEWANEYAWAIVGLTLAGQSFETDTSLTSVDLGTAYKRVQQTPPHDQSTMLPLYKWSEFPISDPKVQNLVRFANPGYASKNDPVRSATAEVLAHLASLGYFESPLAVSKELDIGSGWTASLHLVPGDKVVKVNDNLIAVLHQSGALYKVSKTYDHQNGVEEPVDHDYWGQYGDFPVLWEQPVIVDKEYAAAHGFSEQVFDAYMKAKDTAYADLDYPGMAGTTKGESLVFMKKYLSGSSQYKTLVDKIPAMPEGTLKYLHYNAKAGLTDPFDFAMLLDAHGQFDPMSMPSLTYYKTPDGAPWAQAMTTYGSGPDAIFASWGDAVSINAYASVLGKHTYDSNVITWDEAKELSDVISGKVMWTDPNAPVKDKATKGTLIFTKTGKTLGGMHTKYVWADQYGNEWMSKAFASDPMAKARVDAEHYACEISRLFGYGAPESRIEKSLDGEYAYLQYLAPSPKDFTGVDWHDLSADLTAKVMSEHVLDWIISNHDTHERNLLYTEGMDDFFGIDKGQAFKVFPADELAEGYRPSSNPDPVWYDRIYAAIRTKTLPKDTADLIVDRVLRKAAYVSVRHDEEYRAALEGAFKNREKFPSAVGGTRQGFIDALMARKAHTFEDFEALYKGLYQQAGWDWPGKAKDEYLPKKIGTAHVAVTPDFANDVLASGSAGQALFFAGPELEDGHMIFFTTVAPDKSTVLRAETKLREDADATFTAWLQKHTIQKVSGYPTSSQPVADYSTLYGLDTAFSALANYVSTVNHHVEDKEYNATTVTNAKDVMTNLQTQVSLVESKIAADPLVLGSAYNNKFVTAEQQATWLTAAKGLLENFEVVDKAYVEQVKTPFSKSTNPLVAPSYKPSPGLDTSGKPKVQAAYEYDGITYYKWSDGNYIKMLDGNYVISDDGEFTNASHSGTPVSVGEVEPVDAAVETSVSVANKVVSVKHHEATTYDGHFDGKSQQFLQFSDSGGKGMTGMEYEISYGNIKVKYMPFHGSNVALAQQGLLRLEVTDWDGSTPDIETMLAVLRDTGLELTEADETDLEILYWRRLAGIVKDRSDKGNTKNAALLQAVSKIQGMESKTAERDALRKAWEVFYGADGVAQAVADKAYLPVFASPRKNPEETDLRDVGQPVWYRPKTGVTYKDIFNWTHGKMPRHSVTYQGFESGEDRMPRVLLSGGLLSTEERIRVVGWVEGGSSDSDQGYGSSAFNYFKQRSGYQGWDFIAEPTIYFRDSNYAYSQDNFGAIDKRATQAKFGIEETIHTGGTELMLKNYVSVMDDMACVIIPDDHTRKEMIDFYKSLGITSIRGIPIEERFVATSSQAEMTVGKIWQQMFALDNKEGDA